MPITAVKARSRNAAAVDVLQYEIRFPGAVYRADPREPPIQADRTDEGRAGELVVVDVVHFQPAGIRVAQQQIGFAGDAAEITDARELPIQADGADEGGVGDLIVGDVVPPMSALRPLSGGKPDIEPTSPNERV
jgi:hypothetical protein